MHYALGALQVTQWSPTARCVLCCCPPPIVQLLLSIAAILRMPLFHGVHLPKICAPGCENGLVNEERCACDCDEGWTGATCNANICTFRSFTPLSFFLLCLSTRLPASSSLHHVLAFLPTTLRIRTMALPPSQVSCLHPAESKCMLIRTCR